MAAELPAQAQVPDCAFYAVADHRHFIGAVALVNSLRLAGHDEPVFLVDAGLTDLQRQRLAPHVTLLPAPEGVAPVYLAPVGPLARPAHVEVLVDADVIVLRSLAPLVERARGGRFVAFVNDPPNDTRFFPEWAAALGLPALAPGRPYLNAGLFLLPRGLADRLLERWLAAQDRIAQGGTRYDGATLQDPFYFADQDVVNAVLRAELDDEELEIVAHALAPHTPLRGVRIADETSLVCEHADGTRPFVLHHTLAKPWLRATVPNAYSRLLPRLLLEPDVALQLSVQELPLRLRPGRMGSAARLLSGVRAAARAAARRQLGRFGVRTRLRELRRTARAAGAGQADGPAA